ncbi:MAG: hypothetical protein V1720_05840 [bacterium]
MKKKNLEKLIFKSLDGVLTEKESAALEYELKNSSEAKKLFAELRSLRKGIENLPELTFKPFFEERVIAKLNIDNSKSESFPNFPEALGLSFRKFAIAAALILALLITYNLNNGNSYSIENLLGTYKTPLEYVLDPTMNLIWGRI